MASPHASRGDGQRNALASETSRTSNSLMRAEPAGDEPFYARQLGFLQIVRKCLMTLECEFSRFYDFKVIQDNFRTR